MSNETGTKIVSRKVFLAGVGLTILVYGGLVAGLTLVDHSDTLAGLESSLASKAVLIIQNQKINMDQAHVTEHHEPPIVDTEALSETHSADDVHQVPDHAEPAVSHADVQQDAPQKIGEHQPDPANKTIPSYNALSERVDDYTIPLKPHGDTPSAFEAYRKAYAPPSIVTGNYYALVFYDYGLSDTLSEAVRQNLPNDITLAISPYAASASAKREDLGANEYESWMMLPMETLQFPAVDPGPKALLTRTSYENNQDHLYWTLSRAQGYAGIVAYSDTAFAQAKPVFGALMKEVFDRGLGYVDLNSDGNAQIGSIAARYPNRYAQASVNFDKYSADYSGEDFPELATSIVENRIYSILVFPLTDR